MIDVKLFGGVAEILLYGVIGDFMESGITAKDFVTELKAKTKRANSVLVRINTPGGSINHGLAMFSALESLGKPVTTQVDGVAASMGSVILLAGSKRLIAQDGFVMIHNPQIMAEGDASSLRSTLRQLEKLEAQAVELYARKTKLSKEELAQFMADETWLSASESLEHGFVTQIMKSPAVAACAKIPAKMRRVPDRAAHLFQPQRKKADRLRWQLQRHAARLGKLERG